MTSWSPSAASPGPLLVPTCSMARGPAQVLPSNVVHDIPAPPASFHAITSRSPAAASPGPSVELAPGTVWGPDHENPSEVAQWIALSPPTPFHASNGAARVGCRL